MATMTKTQANSKPELTQGNPLVDDYRADCSAMKQFADTWDDRETMIVGSPADKMSAKQQSQISDGALSTMTMERSFRVMGTLPTGVVKAIAEHDKGKAMLMQIVLQRYIIPNANWGERFLTKLRQWDFYSQVYGAMPMLVDWKVCDGYVGPDCRLIPIRDFTPQRMRASINDCDYVYIDTYHSVADLEEELSNKGTKWNTAVLREIIEEAKTGDKPKKVDKRSSIEQARATFASQGTGKAAQIRLVTKYWKGQDGVWETFAPDYGNKVVRSIPNPHGTGKIPVILKQSFPLVDSIYGLGDFERGESLQKAGDALTNLYFDAVKMSIFRPVIVNPNGVVPHTLKYAPGARWLETIPQSIRPFETSPSGMNTFQGTIGYLKGALNNQAGTTDTMISAESSSDPSFGKTPQALAMQQSRESSRDNWDRFFMEQALEELLDYFVCLVSSRQDTPIEVSIFGDEIQDIMEAGDKDVNDLITVSDSGQSAKLYIEPKQLQDDKKSVVYRYYIDANSTKEGDDKAQNEALLNIFTLFSKVPNLDQMLAQQGKVFDAAENIMEIARTAGLNDPDKLIREMTPQEQQQQQMMQQAQAAQVAQSVPDAVQQGNMTGSPAMAAQAGAPTPSGGPTPVPPKPLVNYKDAPASIQAQMEAADGYQPATDAERAAHAAATAKTPAGSQPSQPQNPGVIVHGQHLHDPQVVAAAHAMFGQ